MLNRIKRTVMTIGTIGMLIIPITSYCKSTATEAVIMPREMNPTQIMITDYIPTDNNNELDDTVIDELESQKLTKERLKKELEKEKRRARIKARKKYIDNIVCDPGNVSRVTGLKEDDYKYLTKGTWWEGKEYILYDLENTYGINAMFAMSVSTLESGHGKSERARIRENYYGIELNHYWSNLYDNTMFFGKMIKKNYVKQGRKGVYSISTKYCPPHHDMWADYMYEHMHKLNNKLISRLNRTNK